MDLALQAARGVLHGSSKIALGGADFLFKNVAGQGIRIAHPVQQALLCAALHSVKREEGI